MCVCLCERVCVWCACMCVVFMDSLHVCMRACILVHCIVTGVKHSLNYVCLHYWELL